jgi:hypothetical protein
MTLASGSRMMTAANLLIYFSVALGLLLLYEANGQVPSWLLYSLAGGWVAYVVVGIAAWKGIRYAYPFACVLALLVLAASLSAPEHYSFFTGAVNLPAVIFLVGDLTQVLLLVAVSSLFISRRAAKSSQQATTA